MNDRLKSRFERLEGVRQRIEARIDGVAPGTLNRQPAPGRWSVAQVIGHLLKAETLSVSYIRKKASDPSKLRSAGLKEALLAAVVVVMMRVPLKMPAPDIVSEFPENEDPAELRERWMRLRGEMSAMLDQIPDSLLSKCLYKHPAAGPMTLESALDFMVAHATRHAGQIDRVLASLDS